MHTSQPVHPSGWMMAMILDFFFFFGGGEVLLADASADGLGIV